MSEPTRFYTVTQARERLGISYATFRRMVRDEQIASYPNHTDKRSKLYRVADIDHIAEQSVPQQNYHRDTHASA